jgi:hypothetical protein
MNFSVEELPEKGVTDNFPVFWSIDLKVGAGGAFGTFAVLVLLLWMVFVLGLFSDWDWECDITVDDLANNSPSWLRNSFVDFATWTSKLCLNFQNWSWNVVKLVLKSGSIFCTN